MPVILILLMAFLSGCARDHFVTTKDGVGIAYEYKQAEGEKGTAVLLHGLGSRLEEWHDFSRFLNKNGWSIIALDFRGHGLSVHRGDEELKWKKFKDEDYMRMTEDIEAVLGNFRDVPKIWIIGSSMGADFALLYGVRNPAVRGVVLLSPSGSRGSLGTGEAYAAYGFRPFLIAASADDGIALQTAERIHQRMRGPKKIIRYEKAGHASAMLENESKLREEILEWMNRHTI